MQQRSPQTENSTVPESQPSPHTHDSSYRESLLEHLFTGAVMSHLWQRSYTRLEVLKPQVDNSGYDVVMEANGIVRHIQLKTSYIGSATARVNVHLALARKPSGCVIWIKFRPSTLDLGPFLWFGGAPGQKLTSITDWKITKHPKGNAQGVKLERPNLRVVPRARFTELATIDQVVERLFGSLSVVDDLAEVEVDVEVKRTAALCLISTSSL